MVRNRVIVRDMFMVSGLDLGLRLGLVEYILVSVYIIVIVYILLL